MNANGPSTRDQTLQARPHRKHHKFPTMVREQTGRSRLKKMKAWIDKVDRLIHRQPLEKDFWYHRFTLHILHGWRGDDPVKKDGEDRMLSVLVRLEYENPYQELNELLDELYRNGEFLYVTHPDLVHPRGYRDTSKAPAYMRLSSN